MFTISIFTFQNKEGYRGSIFELWHKQDYHILLHQNKLLKQDRNKHQHGTFMKSVRLSFDEEVISLDPKKQPR